MKFIIDVKDEQAKAVHQVLKGLQAAGLILSIAPEKKDADDTLIQPGLGIAQPEKSAHDFVEQYRDLVD